MLFIDRGGTVELVLGAHAIHATTYC
jgi:hypothetical protein